MCIDVYLSNQLSYTKSALNVYMQLYNSLAIYPALLIQLLIDKQESAIGTGSLRITLSFVRHGRASTLHACIHGRIELYIYVILVLIYNIATVLCAC